MATSDPKIAVLNFNDCINRQDIEGLCNLMCEDYTFIDSANEVRRGKEKGIKDWLRFFGMFGDYKNVFTRLDVRGDMVIMEGYSTCRDKRLEGPAIWTARVKDGKIEEWRVYENTGENRKKLEVKDNI